MSYDILSVSPEETLGVELCVDGFERFVDRVGLLVEGDETG